MAREHIKVTTASALRALLARTTEAHPETPLLSPTFAESLVEERLRQASMETDEDDEHLVHRGAQHVETEINVQLGSLTMNSSSLEMLNRAVSSMADFVQASYPCFVFLACGYMFAVVGCRCWANNPNRCNAPRFELPRIGIGCDWSDIDMTCRCVCAL